VRGVVGSRRAQVEDLQDTARSLPHVVVERDGTDHPVYRVGQRSFLFFRTPRPDARDPVSGERYDDVVVVWVESEAEKQALVQDPTTPWFTTAHFDGHPSVLLRTSRVGELTRRDVVEQVQEAWLAQASDRRGRRWLAEQRLSGPA